MNDEFLATPISELKAGGVCVKRPPDTAAATADSNKTGNPPVYSEMLKQMENDLHRGADAKQTLDSPASVSPPPPVPPPLHSPQSHQRGTTLNSGRPKRTTRAPNTVPTPEPQPPHKKHTASPASHLTDKRTIFVALIVGALLYATPARLRILLPSRAFDQTSGALNIVGVVGLAVLAAASYRAFDVLQKQDGQ